MTTTRRPDDRGRMTFCRRALTAILALMPAAGALAFEPSLPAAARLTGERISPLDSYQAPIGVFDGQSVPSMTVEGAIARRAWRIDVAGLTALQVMVPLRQQLGAEGYTVIFECPSETCGGFDFRFNVEVLPGPTMYVNISRFRFLTAVRGDPEAPENVVSILASVTAGSAHLQIVDATVGVDPAAALEIATEEPERAPSPAAPAQDMEAELFSNGRIVLEDLDFGIGTSDLGQGPFASLEALADLLRRRPGLRVALVGHTDSVGGLPTNIALSRDRARSVRQRMIADFGTDPDRLEAEGMGYLAPIAPNTTAEGRARNRRVEAILISED